MWRTRRDSPVYLYVGHLGIGWGIRRPGWAAPVYGIGDSPNHPNPLINGPKVSPLKKVCTVDPTVQSIQMGANPGIKCNSGRSICGPFRWTIKCAPLPGAHQITKKKRCAGDNFCNVAY